MGSGWVGVHTGRVNKVVAEAIKAKRIATFNNYQTIRHEVNVEFPGLAKGRLDLGLYDGPDADALVEIKNVTLLDGSCLRFPDAVTTRGQRHLNLLLAAHQAGWRAVMLFVINRPEGDFFAPDSATDPVYAQRLIDVAAVGVEILAIRLIHGPQDLDVGAPVEIRLQE
jgi:sugar fermentation stimulation protein A